MLRCTLHANDPIKLKGWVFLATLESKGDAGTIIRRAPGFDGEIPARFRTAKPECDHCNTARRRKDTYLVRNAETDEGVKQVGSTCLKAYTGISPAALLSRINWVRDVAALADDDYGMGGGGSMDKTLSLAEFLSHTACMIREHGWLSRAAARDNYGCSTADAAIENMVPPPPNTKAFRDWEASRINVLKADVEAATASIAWAEKFNDAAASEFESNLGVLASVDRIEYRDLGLAAAIVFCYQRAADELRRQARQAQSPSEYVGEIKKRISMVLTVTDKREMPPTEWGSSTLVSFEDDDGNAVKWFASGSSCWACIGQTYHVKATPTRHSMYRGEKQTTVNRATTEWKTCPACGHEDRFCETCDGAGNVPLTGDEARNFKPAKRRGRK
jgi:hypothetical protein